jgi:hypothetical protein
LPAPTQGTAKLFSGEVSGLLVQLPGWQFPAVIDTLTGVVSYDNYSEHWGEQRQLDKFLQMYAVEKAKLEARKKGYTVSEQTLQDGSPGGNVRRLPSCSPPPNSSLGRGRLSGDGPSRVGTWKCEYKIGDQMLTAELTIKKDGDKLAGTMSWPDQKDAKLKDVKLKDDTLTFSARRKFMDNEFPLDFTLKIDGDKFKGKSAAEFMSNKREFDIEGKREKKDK